MNVGDVYKYKDTDKDSYLIVVGDFCREDKTRRVKIIYGDAQLCFAVMSDSQIKHLCYPALEGDSMLLILKHGMT